MLKDNDKMVFRIVAFLDSQEQAQEIAFIKHIVIVAFRSRMLGKQSRKTKKVRKHECNKKNN